MVVQMLLDREAEVRVQDDLGLTPLHMASQEGHLEVTRRLLNPSEKCILQGQMLSNEIK